MMLVTVILPSISFRYKSNFTTKPSKNRSLVAKLAIITRTRISHKPISITDNRVSRSTKQLPGLHTVIARRKRSTHFELTKTTFDPNVSLALIGRRISSAIFRTNTLLIIKANLQPATQIFDTTKTNTANAIVHKNEATTLHLYFTFSF